MKLDLLARARRKALTSRCTYKVCAIALDHKHDAIAVLTNVPAIGRKSGWGHAEMRLMRRYGRAIRHILLLRVNRRGDLMPISPCKACAAQARKLGISIKEITCSF